MQEFLQLLIALLSRRWSLQESLGVRLLQLGCWYSLLVDCQEVLKERPQEVEVRFLR